MESLRAIFWKGAKRPFSNCRVLLFSLFIFARIPLLYLITGFLAMGYILRVGRLTQLGKWELPLWKDYLELFKNGFFGWLIVLIYFLPALAISLAIYFIWPDLGFPKFGLNILEMTNYFEALLGLLKGLGYPLIILWGWSYLMALYLIPCALLRYVQENKFSDAFKFKFLLKKTFSKNYSISWVILELTPALIITAISFFRDNYYTVVLSTSPIKYLFLIILYLVIAFKEYFVNVLAYSVYGTVLKGRD